MNTQNFKQINWNTIEPGSGPIVVDGWTIKKIKKGTDIRRDPISTYYALAYIGTTHYMTGKHMNPVGPKEAREIMLNQYGYDIVDPNTRI